MKAAAILAAVAACAGAPAFAQPLTREELQSALQQRDQQIAALEKRIATLEAERSAPARGPGEAIQTVPAPDPGPASAAAPAIAKASEDDASLQALSRGLVERGLLLLPPWSVEVSPAAAYSHSQTQGLVLVDTPEGISTVSDQRLREDSVETSLSARVGLPWRSQLQVSVPYDWKRTDVSLGDGSEVVHSASHLGDLQLELSHQFLVESGWRPDVIGAVSWRAPTGSDPYRVAVTSVATGAGANQLTGRVTLLKTLDPLVLFNTVSYGHSFGYKETFGQVQAGNSLDWQMGALLAVNPDTSLSFGFDQQFRGVTRVDKKAIAGSDGVAAALQFGIDQVINARTLLDISVGVGVTRDAPDYTVMVSLPIRLR